MKLKIRDITEIGIIAALYIVMTLIVPISFGPIQFRISEFLNFLVIFKKEYAIGVIIGVFIANLFSSYGLDVIFGTGHTIISFVACLLIFKWVKNKKMRYATIIVVFSAFIAIIAWEITIIDQAPELFWELYATLFLSEVAVLTLGAFVMWQVEKMLRRMNILEKEEQIAIK